MFYPSAERGLVYPKQFVPIDALKIDQAFVSDIDTDADDTVNVSAVIAIGKSLKQRVIAEGVETQGQLDFLRTQQCDEGQVWVANYGFVPRSLVFSNLLGPVKSITY